MLPEQIGFNKHAIEFVNDKQPSYRLIYILSPVELKMLKTYIKTNIVNGSIGLFKSAADALILIV